MTGLWWKLWLVHHTPGEGGYKSSSFQISGWLFELKEGSGWHISAWGGGNIKTQVIANCSRKSIFQTSLTPNSTILFHKVIIEAEQYYVINGGWAVQRIGERWAWPSVWSTLVTQTERPGLRAVRERRCQCELRFFSVTVKVSALL